MNTGDIVGVELNFDEGTIGFTINGRDLGLAPTRNIEGREFYAAVSLLDAGDQVTLRPAAALPQATPTLQIGEVTDTSSPLRFMRQKPVCRMIIFR